MKTKAWKAIGLALCLVMSLMTLPQVSASEITTDIKADLLNDMAILKGDGSGYNLSGVLSRKEAITFITRLNNKEDSVLDNRSQYIETGLIDVESNQWYAPYVGYGVEAGILTGYADGSFKPDADLNGKAFLKMILVSLGYEYNQDFTWTNVLDKAQELGLIAGSDYYRFGTSGTNFYREDVVNIIYRALKTQSRVSDQKLIYTFIDAGVISDEVAAAYGVIDDLLKMEIEEITSEAENELVITFNETIENVGQVDIYPANNYDAKAGIDQVEYDGNKMTIKTTDMGIDQAYKVYVLDSQDGAGNVVDELTGDFISYRPEEIEADYFRLSKIEVISKNIVDLYFTHPINENALEEDFYNIYLDDQEVYTGSSDTLDLSLKDDNDQVLRLKFKSTDWIEGETRYQLLVAGDLMSVFGTPLKEAAGDRVNFTPGSTVTEDAFELEEVEALDARSLKVTFSQNVDQSLAEKVVNYDILDEDGATISIDSAKVEASSNQVILYLNDILSKYEWYSLLVNLLPNESNTEFIIDESKDFSGLYASRPDLEVEEVFPVNANVIYVEFNHALDPETAGNPDNYLLYGVSNSSFSTKPQSAVYDPKFNPNVVKLYLPADEVMEDDDTYRMVVLSNVKDIYDQRLNTSYNQNFDHNGTGPRVVEVDTAKQIAADTVRIDFTMDIEFSLDNISVSNYWLEYEVDGVTKKKVPVSVIYYPSKTIVLKFDTLEEEEYTVHYGEVIDFSGQSTKGSDLEEAIVLQEGLK